MVAKFECSWNTSDFYLRNKIREMHKYLIIDNIQADILIINPDLYNRLSVVIHMEFEKLNYGIIKYDEFPLNIIRIGKNSSVLGARAPLVGDLTLI